MLSRIILTAELGIRCLPTLYPGIVVETRHDSMSTLHDINMEKNAPCFQLRTGGSGHRFHNGKNRAAQTESNQRSPACNSTALVPRAIYDTEGGRRVNNTTLFSSVVPLRPHTPGPGLCNICIQSAGLPIRHSDL